MELKELIELAKKDIPSDVLKKKHIDLDDISDYDRIGGIYSNGKEIPANLEIAFEWYKIAKENGEYYGFIDLVNCYENGRGTKKDMAKRLETLIEFTRSFGGEAPKEAYLYIAECYEKGLGTEIDLNEAKKWKKTAEK